MGNRKSYPIAFRPKGLVDAFDATEKFGGACLNLDNLVFAPGNPELVVPRPGVISLSTFGSFTTPGVVSVFTVIDQRVYGMIASGLNAGKDQPFCWDNAAQAFVSISGITNGNSPTTPSATGAWTAPTMASVGPYIIVTHPGFPGGATKFGWIDLTNPAVPAWNAGDTATNALPSVPTAVANYNNRAYFACSNYAYYSDVALPLTRTNSNQAVTLGDQGNITALVGLPIQTSSAGIAGALIAFKRTQIWQITGDTLTSNLATNFMSLNVGTNSPRSIAQSPSGIYFCSKAGPYFINQYGAIQQLSFNPGESNEPDIVEPFQDCTEETRMAGGYITGVYRVCLDTVIRGVAGRNDYWFDEIRRRWNGPHTFTYDCAGQLNSKFILTSNVNTANLIQSEAVGVDTSVYTDLGVVYQCTMESAQFPKTRESDMNMNQVVESQIELSESAAAMTVSVQAIDENKATLNSLNMSIPASGIWGSGLWGDGQVWASSEIKPVTYQIPWSAPLVFKKMQLLVQALADPALVIGSFFARYQRTGYVLQNTTGSTGVAQSQLVVQETF